MLKADIVFRWLLLLLFPVAGLASNGSDNKANNSVTSPKTKVVVNKANLSKSQYEALYIGKMVQDLQLAINSPSDPRSLKTISYYGNDSRYYSMVRGWLFQELVGVESQLHASKSPSSIAKFQAHSDFLKKAIRLVDLE